MKNSNRHLNKKCIFRGDRSGVFFGTLIEKEGKEVDLYDVIHTKDYQQYEKENWDLLPQYILTELEYETIKKALEVNK